VNEGEPDPGTGVRPPDPATPEPDGRSQSWWPDTHQAGAPVTPPPAAPAAEPEPSPPAPPAKKQMNPVLEIVLILAAALGLWYVTNGWVVKPYRIPSASMEPTLDIGDRVLVNRFIYRLHDPHRGDIVVFHPPGRGDQAIKGADTEASVYYIKRIIGLPGETIMGHDGQVEICKAPSTDCRALKEPYLTQRATASDFGPVRIPKGQYFMMGDNRAISDDSRDWGTLPRGFIIGEAFATYWPLDRLRTL
jgi:signal peptidase I